MASCSRFPSRGKDEPFHATFSLLPWGLFVVAFAHQMVLEYSIECHLLSPSTGGQVGWGGLGSVPEVEDKPLGFSGSCGALPAVSLSVSQPSTKVSESRNNEEEG